MASVSTSAAKTAVQTPVPSLTNPHCFSIFNQSFITGIFQQIIKIAESTSIDQIDLHITYTPWVFVPSLGGYLGTKFSDASSIDAKDQNLKHVATRLIDIFKALHGSIVSFSGGDVYLNLDVGLRVFRLNSNINRYVTFSVKKNCQVWDFVSLKRS